MRLNSKKLRYRRPPFLGGQRNALACGAQSAPWKSERKAEEKTSFLLGFLFAFLLPRNSPGDVNQSRGNSLVFYRQQHRGCGSRGTEPKRRLWRMKRGAVLNRNEHATGREQATIEVADSQYPGAEQEGPQRPENLPVADFQRGRAGRPRIAEASNVPP